MRRRVEAADQVHQRRLAGARRPHDRDVFAALDCDRDPAQGVDLLLAHHVGLPEIAGFNQGHGCTSFRRPDRIYGWAGGARSILRLFFLVFRLQPGHDRRIGQGRGVAERLAFGDVAQQPPHDLARSGLRQIGGEEDLVGPGDRADLLDDVLLELVGQLRRRRLTPSFSVTNAATAWPLISCGRPTTAASATFGWSTSALSTSIVPSRCPATFSTSSTRPSSQKKPSSSRRAPSPVK